MKYFISELKYRFNDSLSVFSRLPRDFEKLKKDGFAVIPNYISGTECDNLINIIDNNIDAPRVWVDAQNSDHRIFGFEEFIPDGLNLFNEKWLRGYFNNYIDRFKYASFILAGKLRYTQGNIGSGGGWHRDSLNVRQLKYILYLTDVDEENGPFQFLVGSHRPLEKLRINRLLGKKLNAHRYDESDINRLIDMGYDLRTLAAEKGTLIIAETSGIHRGKPIEKGFRYALTNYMFDREIPHKFGKLKSDL